MSGNHSRNKGAVGEREVAALIQEELGFKVQRRIRADGGDGDLIGVPGWSIEVKRAAKPLLRQWWDQAARQAHEAGKIPVLFYRIDRCDWRVVWPLGAVLSCDWANRYAFEWTCESNIQAWTVVARENLEE